MSMCVYLYSNCVFNHLSAFNLRFVLSGQALNESSQKETRQRFRGKQSTCMSNFMLYIKPVEEERIYSALVNLH